MGTVLTDDTILSVIDPTPLSTFLRNTGIGTDRTLFVTIASKSYIEPMINFKIALDKWNLGGNYVVLCLDIECAQAAESSNIIAFDGYFMSGKESKGDWHFPIARIKVPSRNFSSDHSSPQIST